METVVLDDLAARLAAAKLAKQLKRDESPTPDVQIKPHEVTKVEGVGSEIIPSEIVHEETKDLDGKKIVKGGDDDSDSADVAGKVEGVKPEHLAAASGDGVKEKEPTAEELEAQRLQQELLESEAAAKLAAEQEAAAKLKARHQVEANLLYPAFVALEKGEPDGTLAAIEAVRSKYSDTAYGNPRERVLNKLLGAAHLQVQAAQVKLTEAGQLGDDDAAKAALLKKEAAEDLILAKINVGLVLTSLTALPSVVTDVHTDEQVDINGQNFRKLDIDDETRGKLGDQILLLFDVQQLIQDTRALTGKIGQLYVGIEPAGSARVLPVDRESAETLGKEKEEIDARWISLGERLEQRAAYLNHVWGEFDVGAGSIFGGGHKIPHPSDRTLKLIGTLGLSDPKEYAARMAFNDSEQLRLRTMTAEVGHFQTDLTGRIAALVSRWVTLDGFVHPPGWDKDAA